MKPLTHDQIEAVIQWMNGWNQLKDTSIPLRFKEDWTQKQSVSDQNSTTNERPPLGLKPKWIHDQHRQSEILSAMNRYLEAGKTPPKEWALEFASYCK